ncbi:MULTISPECIES: DUF6021 family protein [Pseudomonas syringae group]|uniref:Uncharacterized protein n=3 Tax=Pseudomonas syringae group TaxID=136849 RepID=A0A0P9RB34_PSECA|nr:MULTISPECIES: DUF6021 family protein [Pseudomonas syringae group]KPB68816.1 Uncharacterized protein AC507_1855 [Pseudomonas syringae pv. maculicola]KPW81033.1 Uncharacterized protein ALO81_03226 [Pseudomonas cannabina]MBM0139407.1 hypothetical protein [Pseudomonas cannabina pv. alisalensis]QQN20404.1 hypothetical protein JGS08_17450 [Pseudomonas cannabina pv. alisalensis]RMN37308.1 hypothetical protein ALQ64_04386 [Pseudomonas cannabina]
MTGTTPDSKNETKDNLGFDEESPEKEDPQVDPTEAAETEATEKGTTDDYPPYMPKK